MPHRRQHPRPRPRWVLAGVGVLVLAVVAIGVIGYGRGTARLTGVTWQLTSYDSTAVDATTQRVPTLEFGTGYRLYDACNHDEGSYQLVYNRIHFGAQSGTAIGCGSTGPHDAVVTVVAGLVTWHRDGGRLVLSGHGHSVTFSDHGPPASALVRASFRVGFIGHLAPGGGESGYQGPPRATLRFTSDGRIEGSDGCSTYSAAYTATATTIVTSGFHVVPRPCASNPLVGFVDRVLTGSMTWTWNRSLRLVHGTAYVDSARL